MPDTPAAASYQVEFQPTGQRAELRAGGTLLAAAQTAGVELVSICGGMGTCGGCRVRITAGELSPLTLDEQATLEPVEIEQGMRLACQAIPMSDVRIDIPKESLVTAQRLQIEGQGADVPLSPAVKPVDVQIAPPTLHDVRADDARLISAVQALGLPAPQIPLPVLEDLSDRLRQNDWQVRLAVRQDGGGGEVAAVLPLLSEAPPLSSLAGTLPWALLGLAVDVGTTKLAAYLLDLATGRLLGQAGAMNPQIAYGEDVIGRIAYAGRESGGAGLLQEKLVLAVNQLAADLCSQAGASVEQIVDAVVVGNTAMHHLFAGLPVRQLGVSPYVPAVSAPLTLRARDLGLHFARGAAVFLPPNVAGYVGADHVSMLLGAGLAPDHPKTVLALDIGTNTEISLISKGRIWACSTASGPAFEGAHIRDGMRAAPGAVERVQIKGETIHLQTVGGARPVGICGSGVLDAVAELLESGAIDARGGLKAGHPLVRGQGATGEVVLASPEQTGHGRPVSITRKDINEIQLAKGAIRTGIEVLLASAGLVPDQVDEWVIAGAFGTYLDVRSALRTGMFPLAPVGRFHQVGNAAGTGARQMLLSTSRREAAQALARQIEYLELTVRSDFSEKFFRAIMF